MLKKLISRNSVPSYILNLKLISAQILIKKIENPNHASAPGTVHLHGTSFAMKLVEDSRWDGLHGSVILKLCWHIVRSAVVPGRNTHAKLVEG